jgi:hypothetical protein
MKKLGERNVALLINGVKVTGNFVEAYYYAEEQLYVNEASTIQRFCEHLDKEIGGASSHNIEQLFRAFINPQDTEAAKFALEVKKRIAELRPTRQ